MKIKKLFALLLVILMVFSLIPVSAFADGEETPAEPEKTLVSDEITIGNPNAAYKLTVKNDGQSTQKVNYTITINGASQTIALAGGEYAQFGLNEGDSYSVVNSNETVSPYYKVTSSTGSFTCGEKVKSNIGDTWSHNLGQGFKTGKKDVYKVDGVEIDASDVTKVDDKTYYQTSSATTWTAQRNDYETTEFK